MPEPWDPAKRARIKAKIDKESRRAAARLGAEGCLIIAFFNEGDYTHVQDGGSTFLESYKRTYEELIRMHGIMEASGGEDVMIQ